MLGSSLDRLCRLHLSGWHSSYGRKFAFVRSASYRSARLRSEPLRSARHRRESRDGGDETRAAVDKLRGVAPSLDAFDDLLDALEDDDLADPDLYDRLERLRDSGPRGEACSLVWRDGAKATSAGSITATEFILRRIIDLRRSGHQREARGLRDLLPDRDAWREWTNTYAIPDANAQNNARAYRDSEMHDYQAFISGGGDVADASA